MGAGSRGRPAGRGRRRRPRRPSAGAHSSCGRNPRARKRRGRRIRGRASAAAAGGGGRPAGRQRARFCEPKRATTGVPTAAARCIGPLSWQSMPSNCAASAAKSGTASGGATAAGASAGALSDLRRSAIAPPARRRGPPGRRVPPAPGRKPAAKFSSGQRRQGLRVPGWTSRRGPGSGTSRRVAARSEACGTSRTARLITGTPAAARACR